MKSRSAGSAVMITPRHIIWKSWEFNK